MRKLPFLLVLLLLSLMLLAAAASAHVLSLPTSAIQAAAPSVPDSEEAEADDEGGGETDEAEEDESGEAESCEAEDAEEAELCAEIEMEEKQEQEEGEQCVLEDASAAFAVARGADRVRLSIRYHAFETTAVQMDVALHGAKGSLHLGSERGRFHPAGVFRYSFELGEKQMAKALAAKQLDVRLRALGAPARCELDLSTRAPRRAR